MAPKTTTPTTDTPSLRALVHLTVAFFLMGLVRKLRGPRRSHWTYAYEVSVTTARWDFNHRTRLPLDKARRYVHRLSQPTSALLYVQRGPCPQIPNALRTAPSPQPDNPQHPLHILYIPGDDLVGSPHTHADLIARLCQQTQAPVTALDLNPQDPLPQRLQTTTAALHTLMDTAPQTPVALVGDGSGGLLAICAALQSPRTNPRPPVALGLISPWTDLRPTSALRSQRSDADWQPLKGRRKAAKAFAANADPNAPVHCPAIADLSGLPPMMIQVGDEEALKADVDAFEARAKEAGVAVEREAWEEMCHGFARFSDATSEGELAIEALADFLQRMAAPKVPDSM